jgi:polysaccharide export outer membrane protein
MKSKTTMTNISRVLAGLGFLAVLQAGLPQTTPAKLTAVTANNAKPSASASLDAGPNADYVIGADDVLAINVWKEPELSRSVPVRPDGKVTLPLIGDIVASGTTPQLLQANIETLLTKYISKPVVTVIVQEAKSHKFNIVGEVQKPGNYLLTGPTTVLDAIAEAGGFREWAKTKSIYVLRTGPSGLRERFSFNYKRVIKGGALNQNIQLRPGDTIVVP